MEEVLSTQVYCSGQGLGSHADTVVLHINPVHPIRQEHVNPLT